MPHQLRTGFTLFSMPRTLASTSSEIRRPGLLAYVSLLALVIAAPGASAEDATQSQTASGEKEKADAPAVVQLQTLTVTDQATTQEGSAENGYRNTTGWVGPLGKTNLKDTPYSLNVTSDELVENSGAHSLADALKTNPTVFVAQSQLTDTRGMNDSIIRGFNTTYLKDGLYVNSYNMPSIEDVERIEVLNGPSAFLYGYTNPGGVINYVTKKPTTTPLASFTTGTYGGGQFYEAFDFGGPMVGGGDKLTYRLNGFNSDGGTFVDHQTLHSNMLAFDVDYQIAPDTVLRPHLYHTEFVQKGAQAQFLLGNGVTVPSAPDVKKLYGQSWSLNQVTSNQGGMGIESKLNDTFTFRGDYNYSDMMWYDQMIKSTLTDNSGHYSETFRYFGPQHYYTHTGYALMDANFSTGSIHHDVTFGYWGQNEQDDDSASAQTLLGTSSLDSPVYFSRPSIDTPTNRVSHIEWFYNSALIADRVTFNDSWSVVAGGNQTYVHELYKNTVSGVVTEHYDDSKLSPSAAVIYKPIPSVSTYASYMERLEFGDQASSTAANANEILAPSTSKQYEVGAKSTIGQMDLNTALFYINKVNAQLDSSNYYRQDGREIHQGLEVTGTGKLTNRLSLTGGFTVLDAFVDKTSSVAQQGKTPIDVPNFTAKGRAEYTLPDLPDFFVSGGANYIGRRPVDSMNLQSLPSVVTFDAGLRWEPEIYGHKTKLALNVDNLFNKSYWLSYTSRNGLQFGEPRTFSLSAKLAW